MPYLQIGILCPNFDLCPRRRPRPLEWCLHRVRKPRKPYYTSGHCVPILTRAPDVDSDHWNDIYRVLGSRKSQIYTSGHCPYSDPCPTHRPRPLQWCLHRGRKPKKPIETLCPNFDSWFGCRPRPLELCLHSAKPKKPYLQNGTLCHDFDPCPERGPRPLE